MVAGVSSHPAKFGFVALHNLLLLGETQDGLAEPLRGRKVGFGAGNPGDHQDRAGAHGVIFRPASARTHRDYLEIRRRPRGDGAAN